MVGRQAKKKYVLPYHFCFVLFSILEQFPSIFSRGGGGGLRVSGGLWLEGLIHKVAYFRNFTVL